MKKQTKRRLKISAVAVTAAGAVVIAVALVLILPHRTVPVLMYHGFTAVSYTHLTLPTKRIV